MVIGRATALLEKYAVCPECGNQYLGNGEGSIEIDDNKFRRTCKCGFEVVITDNAENKKGKWR